MSVSKDQFPLSREAQSLVHLALINATLRALVAAHPAPAHLDAALDREFDRAFKPSARPAIAQMRDVFLAELRAGGAHHG